MYVLDDRKAFRDFSRMEIGAVVLEVKKFVTGFAEWNDRIGVDDLKIAFEATPSVEVSLNGCRIENAILR